MTASDQASQASPSEPVGELLSERIADALEHGDPGVSISFELAHALESRLADTRPTQATSAKEVMHSEWRDIASAPRDGTNFLATMRGDGDLPYWVLFWNGEAFECVSSGKPIPTKTEIVGGWTHWQPLPAPPSDSDRPRFVAGATGAVAYLRDWIDNEGAEATEFCDKSDRGAYPVYRSPPDQGMREAIKIVESCPIKYYPHNSSGLLQHQIDLARECVLDALRAALSRSSSGQDR